MFKIIELCWHRTCVITMLVLPVLWTAATANAQKSWPGHAVRLVVPQSAGAGTDTVARLLSDQVGQRLGVTVVVENRPGANGIVATAAVAKSPADGYTLLMAGVSQISFNPSIYKDLPYDAERDFTYVAPVVNTPFVLVASKHSQYTSLEQVIQHARAEPDNITYASAGSGNSTHLATAMLAATSGIALRHVPYKGSGPALSAVIGGQVDLMTSVLGTALPHIQSGNLTALAVLTEARVSDLPQVPTLREAGIDAPTMPGWMAIMGPAGLEPIVVQRLNNAFQAAISDPVISKKLQDMYFVPLRGEAADMQARAVADARTWGAFITRAGLQAE